MLMMLGNTSAQDSGVIALPNVELFEQDIVTGNTLDDKSTAYFYMTITDRYFTGKEDLAIRVKVESFDSDPDIFISKVKYLKLYSPNLFLDQPNPFLIHGQRLVLRKARL
jgi:hypothetical protein